MATHRYKEIVMNTREFQPADEAAVQRIRAAFDQQPLPPRPPDAETIRRLNEIIKLGGPVPSRSLLRSKIMRISIPFAALAASVALVFALWPTSGRAFAEVVQQIANIEMVKFAITIKQPTKPDLSGSAVARRPNRLRIDWTAGGQTRVNITDYTRGELISFDALSEVKISAIPPAGGFDVVRQLQSIQADATRQVPDEENTLPDTDQFAFADGPMTGNLWIDDTSGLPVRIEMQMPAELGGGECVYSDFVWNAAVDASFFDVPAGRKIVRDTLLAEPTEAELIGVLQIRHAFSDEPYDAEFFQMDPGLVIGRLAYDLNQSPEANHQRQLAALGNVLPALGLTPPEAQDPKVLQARIDYLCMKADQWDHHIERTGGWVGAGVKPGEARPLCWWRGPGGGIRVLYGDLSVHDASEPPIAE
jgi:hypothetical protein